MNTVGQTAATLVQIPSVNPGYDPASRGEATISQWLVDWAEERDFEVEMQEVFPGRRNVILRYRNGKDRPHLLFNGHTDTVGVSDMVISPFGAELRDGRLWGRGAADMKGPLACMLQALTILRENPSRWSGSITLACVVDEECNFLGIRHFLKEDKIKYDYAIVGEPTCFSVVRGCKGCLRFSIQAHGRAAHSSTPGLGQSAINAMAKAILALNLFFENELAQIRHPDLGCSTGSVGIIHGGTGINIVPDFCEIKVDVRLVPGQDWKRTYTAMQKCILRQVGDAGIEWKFEENPLVDQPFCLEENHPLVFEACNATANASAQIVSYSCDASKIAAAGIPCIVFGPGDIAQAHTTDEFIELEDLENGVESYVRLAEKLLSQEK